MGLFEGPGRKMMAELGKHGLKPFTVSTVVESHGEERRIYASFRGEGELSQEKIRAALARVEKASKGKFSIEHRLAEGKLHLVLSGFPTHLQGGHNEKTVVGELEKIRAAIHARISANFEKAAAEFPNRQQ